MLELLCLLHNPRGRAASDRWGWLIDARANAYRRERRAAAPAPRTVPLSRGSLAWTCVDPNRIEVARA